VLWRAMQYASTFGFAVWLRPQDGYLAKDGVAHDGDVATRLGLPGIPAFAETIALATIIALARVTGTRVHLCRLSTAEGAAMVHCASCANLSAIGWSGMRTPIVPPSSFVGTTTVSGPGQYASISL